MDFITTPLIPISVSEMYLSALKSYMVPVSPHLSGLLRLERYHTIYLLADSGSSSSAFSLQGYEVRNYPVAIGAGQGRCLVADTCEPVFLLRQVSA